MTNPLRIQNLFNLTSFDKEKFRFLRDRFNWTAFRRKAVISTIEHTPCLLISFGLSAIGISFLNHNPWLELSLAVVAAVAGQRMYEHFYKNNLHKSGTIKSYAAAVGIGILVWGAHQKLLHKHSHDHEDRHSKHIEESFRTCKLDRNQKVIKFTHRKNHGGPPRRNIRTAHSHTHTLCSFK